MNHESYPDAYIRGILNTVKSIAMVGISPKESRPSYFAFKYLLERGYNMMGVNSRVLTSKKAKLLGHGVQRMSLDRTTFAGGATGAAERAQKAEDGRES